MISVTDSSILKLNKKAVCNQEKVTSIAEPFVMFVTINLNRPRTKKELNVFRLYDTQLRNETF